MMDEQHRPMPETQQRHETCFIKPEALLRTARIYSQKDKISMPTADAQRYLVALQYVQIYKTNNLV